MASCPGDVARLALVARSCWRCALGHRVPRAACSYVANRLIHLLHSVVGSACEVLLQPESAMLSNEAHILKASPSTVWVCISNRLAMSRIAYGSVIKRGAMLLYSLDFAVYEFIEIVCICKK